MSLLKKNSRIESDYDDEERKRQSILGQTHQGSWLDSCLREEEDKEHEFEQNSRLIARCTEKVYREGGKFLYTHIRFLTCVQQQRTQEESWGWMFFVTQDSKERLNQETGNDRREHEIELKQMLRIHFEIQVGLFDGKAWRQRIKKKESRSKIKGPEKRD